MALRGKKPDDRKQRLKLLLYGPAGVGKTTAACQMPKPYIIDTEQGSVHYGELVEKAGGAVAELSDMSEIIAEVRQLMTEPHDYLTLVIDPITTAYHAAADEGERVVGTEFHKHYKQYADKFMRRLMDLVARIDMNVVVTAHSKNQWGKDEKGDPTIIGTTFDGGAKLDYQFDLCLMLDRVDGGTGRSATVTKTRLAEFPDQESFTWSYAEIVKRYGKDRLEKGVKCASLATPDQVAQFTRLFDRLTEPERKALKLSKALKDYGDPADWPADRMAAALQHIEKHMTAASAA